MNHNIYIYIFVMASVTYFIRLVPLALIRKQIKSNYIKSFLYYVPYVTLAVMTFPAILSATSNICSGAVGFAAALVLAYFRKSLITVSLVSSACVFVVELFTGL